MKKIIAIILCVLMVAAIAACANDTPADTATPADPPAQEDTTTPAEEAPPAADDSQLIEVTIPHYKVGDNVGSLYFLPIVEKFNEQYAGRFRLNIEPIPQDMYGEQIMQMGLQGMLPVLIEGGVDDVWFDEFVVPNDLFVDLAPVFENHPTAPYFNADNVAFNTLPDGRLVTVPNPIMFTMQMFYNSEMWQPSSEVRYMNWRELGADLGGESIAFMTGSNAWTLMLPFTSMIAAQPGGVELLNNGLEERITDFSHPAIIAALEDLQYMMQNHAMPNFVGAGFPEAANSFFNNGSAIIANGFWMIGDFGPGGADNWGPDFNPDAVMASVFPGNIALGNNRGYNWWIPSTSSDEEIELAKAFLSFLFMPEQIEFWMTQMGGMIPGFPHTDEFLQHRAEDRLTGVFMGAADANTIIVPAFADAVYPSIAEHDFPSLLPLLFDGTLTPEEFADELTRLTAEATS